MKNNQLENTCLNYKTDENKIAEEIKIALSDYFCGQIEGKEKSVILNLNNGQKFELSIREVI